MNDIIKNSGKISKIQFLKRYYNTLDTGFEIQFKEARGHINLYKIRDCNKECILALYAFVNCYFERDLQLMEEVVLKSIKYDKSISEKVKDKVK